ncbi:MAG: helix-turn-helix domain-containing protein [Faecalibacterium sp.]|mgnify:FL=1
MKFNERLRAIRKEKGLTQAELAEKAGIAVNSVRLYEAGARLPKLDTIARMAVAMGLTANDLMAGQWGKFDGIFLSDEEFQQDDREAQLIYHFRTLNDNGQTVAVERVQELTQIPAYQRRADTAQDVPGGADDKEPAEK